MTTVQLARMGAVIANGGFLVKPHVVRGNRRRADRRVYTQEPPPVQVFEPETVDDDAADDACAWLTWEHGTAHRLHLVGYTLAGKTGTAQIFDFAHHMYTHKYNASFLGFAPMNNPKILVCVTVSGTTGDAGFGASASGPAFQTVAEAALRIREVPRDVPEEVEEIEAKEVAQKAKLKHAEKPRRRSDAVADLATPLTEEELAGGRGRSGCSEDTRFHRQNCAGCNGGSGRGRPGCSRCWETVSRARSILRRGRRCCRGCRSV